MPARNLEIQVTDIIGSVSHDKRGASALSVTPPPAWLALQPPQRVVGVFAHPDDEIMCAGGVMAKWAAEGAEIVVVSATRGEAGQIRDATIATRRILGRVREEELRKACAILGVHDVAVLGYSDGKLQDVAPEELSRAVASVLSEVNPDVVLTFGEDGAYGHPDHLAIGAAAAMAVSHIRRRNDPTSGTNPHLWRSHFPSHSLSLAERLATWLVEMKDRFDGSTDYGRALTLFASESTTMRFASDDVVVSWFPPGSLIVEQGEPATSLYLILSGSVDVVREDAGTSRRVGTLGEGQFFGELGVAHRHPRSANVIATNNVTCLVLSPGKPTKWAARGDQVEQSAVAADQMDAEPAVEHPGALQIDVAPQIHKKLSALAAHRSQYPIDVDAFPPSMLIEMFGIEYFFSVTDRDR
jgi:LmbE family N-acetylglucosaminyl deacetylase